MITHSVMGYSENDAPQVSEEEIEAYKKRAEELYPGTTHIDIYVDGDYVELYYKIAPFERIRRITGYLVGTVDRWNDAKRVELADRVKHGTDNI